MTALPWSVIHFLQLRIHAQSLAMQIWDLRSKSPSQTLTQEYQVRARLKYDFDLMTSCVCNAQVTSVSFSDDSSQVFTGCIDDNIYVSVMLLSLW